MLCSNKTRKILPLSYFIALERKIIKIFQGKYKWQEIVKNENTFFEQRGHGEGNKLASFLLDTRHAGALNPVKCGSNSFAESGNMFARLWTSHSY